MNIKPKIAYLSSCDFEFEETRSALKKLGSYDWIKLDKQIQKPDFSILKDYEILIVSPDAVGKYDCEFFSKLSNLKFVTTVTSGYEYIDLDCAKKHGISVSNCAGANAESVAEHAFGLLIGLSKKIVEFDRAVRQRGEYKYDGFIGHELFQKTIGIIGYGEIGTRIARIAKGFDMKILVHTRTAKSDLSVEFVNLENLLRNSDYVVISAPLNNETKNLINKKTLQLFKNGAYLINISRDEIVNIDDLCEALQSGPLAGFALDGTVYTPIDPRILKFDNVITNAHNAFNTVEANKRVEEYAVENISAFLNGSLIRVVSA